ncbi:MAG: hypothetical protein LBG91_04860 [Treponema sp.]|jgi:hypothetical protein|nr:hypothetical protein [Treponema sp.]
MKLHSSGSVISTVIEENIVKNIVNPGKFLLVCTVISLCAAAPVFSQTENLNDLKKDVRSFSRNLARWVPFNSALGLNWSDAGIGQFPHFGVGLSAGITTIDGIATMDGGPIEKAIEQFDGYFPMKISGLLPGYTVEGRIGGFVLPFDIGLKIGYLDVQPLDNISMNYLLIGGDIRYLLVGENERFLLFPKFQRLKASVGVGFNYMSNKIAMTEGDDKRLDYGGGKYLKMSAPTIGFFWETKALDFKAQVSYSTKFITPYLGVGMNFGWTMAGYRVDAELKGDDVNAINENEIKDIGFTEITSEGFSLDLDKEVMGWNGRVFGGFSFNISNFMIDLTGMYNFVDPKYNAAFQEPQFGASVGVRFQL